MFVLWFLFFRLLFKLCGLMVKVLGFFGFFWLFPVWLVAEGYEYLGGDLESRFGLFLNGALFYVWLGLMLLTTVINLQKFLKKTSGAKQAGGRKKAGPGQQIQGPQIMGREETEAVMAQYQKKFKAGKATPEDLARYQELQKSLEGLGHTGRAMGNMDRLKREGL